MIKIGQYNQLSVIKLVDFGAYLDGGGFGEILIPKRYIDESLQPGDLLNVFIYTDSEDRLIATTEQPLAQVGEFAYLRVSQVNSVGAFLDWGLTKDLLVPYREQLLKMRPNKTYLVYVYLDDTTKRIVASAKIRKFIGNVIPSYKHGEEVDAIAIEKTDIGYRVIVDNKHFGMLYDNELFRPINIGERLKAYIKRIREDGKIDVTLSDATANRVAQISDDIISKLKVNGGILNISDKSSPESIKNLFSCSKKDFKKAIGHLYKERIIELTSDSIKLVN